MMRSMIAILACLFAVGLGAPADLSDRLARLEQQVKVHELAQRVQALRKNQVAEEDAQGKESMFELAPSLEPMLGLARGFDLAMRASPEVEGILG